MSVFEYIIAFMLLHTVFYLLYRLVFSKTRYFEFNRWYLLSALPLSAAIPFIDFSVATYVPQVLVLETFYVNTVQSSQTSFFTSESSFEILWMVYLLGSGLMLSLSVLSVQRMFKMCSESDKKIGSSGTYYQHKSLRKSFSFFAWVFISETEENVPLVCQHEYVHVKHWHSIDKIILQLFRIVFWFHPIWKLYEKSIDETHEYIVDQEISNSVDKNTYVKILLGQLMGVSGFPMTSGFSDKSILKRRIMMMNQSKKRSWGYYLLLVPVLMAMLVVVSCTKGTDTMSDNGDNGIISETAQKEALHANQVDEFPMTENCSESDKKNCFRTAIMEHLTKELSYPEAMKDTGVNDRLYVTFVIDKTGKTNNVKVERGGENHELLRAEALRVVKSIPQFIPAMKDGKAVAMKFAVPIVFKDQA